MKNKILIGVLALTLVLTFSNFVIADNEMGSGVISSQEERQQTQASISGDLNVSVDELRAQIENEIELKMKEGNGYIMRTRDREIESDLTLTQERIQNQSRIHAELSNGRNAEIKIMPETASETAIARLRLKVCNESNNCTIQLKQVGEGNQTRLSYELKAEKEVKILGLFKARMHVESQVDAENGEIIREKKEWWSFLASN